MNEIDGNVVEGVCLHLVDDSFKMRCQGTMYFYLSILDVEDVGHSVRDDVWQDVVVVDVLSDDRFDVVIR